MTEVDNLDKGMFRQKIQFFRQQSMQRRFAPLSHPLRVSPILLVIRVHIYHPNSELKESLPSSNIHKLALKSGPIGVENILRIIDGPYISDVRCESKCVKAGGLGKR